MACRARSSITTLTCVCGTDVCASAVPAASTSSTPRDSPRIRTRRASRSRTWKCSAFRCRARPRIGYSITSSWTTARASSRWTSGLSISSRRSATVWPIGSRDSAIVGSISVRNIASPSRTSTRAITCSRCARPMPIRSGATRRCVSRFTATRRHGARRGRMRSMRLPLCYSPRTGRARTAGRCAASSMPSNGWNRRLRCVPTSWSRVTGSWRRRRRRRAISSRG